MNEFDFAKLLPKETIKINDLEIPKWGSLTPWELTEIQLDPSNRMIDQWAYFTEVILVSRCGADRETLDKQKIPMGITKQIYEFAMNEFRQWKPIEPTEGEKKQLTGESFTSDSDLNTQALNSGDAQST